VEPVAEAELPEIRFVRPVPGFPGLTRFVLVRLGDETDDDDTAVLYELRSVERPEVCFMVAVPAAFFPDYDVELDAHACDDLGLSDAGDALVLVVLTIGSDPSATTANLLAPVVVNARTRAAAQVILSGSDWSVRAAVA
jgi:flagellar assembly factor FliW